VLLAASIYIAAVNGQQATFVPEGSIMFVVQGKSLLRVVPNIKGKWYDKSSGTLKSIKKDDKKQDHRGFLARHFGIFWVSFLYPLRKAHSFPIDASRLKEVRGGDITEWVEKRQKENVTELLWKFPQPFLVKDVELKDGIRINILVYCILEVEKPTIPVFIFRGKFFEQIEAAVSGATAEYANTLPYTVTNPKDKNDKGFVQVNKGQGNRNFTPKYLLALNEKEVKDDDGKRVGERTTLVEQFGIRLSDGWVMEFELSATDGETLKATKAKELEKLRAEGAVEKAKGVAEAIRLRAQAERVRGRQFVRGMSSTGVSPDVAAQVLNSQVRGELLAGPDSKITTLVEGGGSAIVAIPSGSKSSTD